MRRAVAPLGESIRRTAGLSEMMRSRLDPLGESIRRATELNERMRRAVAPLGESIRRTAELSEMMRSRLDPLGESIRRATELNERMSRAVAPLGESIRRTAELSEMMRQRLDPLGESIRRARSTAPLSTFEQFHSVGMAAAAAAVGAPNPAAFATVWRSPTITQFAERLVRDSVFNHELLSRVQSWQFEDANEDLPSGSAVLSAIDVAIQNARVGDFDADSKSVAQQLAAFWENLSGGLKKNIDTFIVGLILLIVEYFLLVPAFNQQEPATQQKIREQRKLAAYAVRELGVSSTTYRVVARDHVPVYSDCRRDAPRRDELEVGQTVQIVQKNRNWCEVIWLAADGGTKGGWVQTRYLRRL